MNVTSVQNISMTVKQEIKTLLVTAWRLTTSFFVRPAWLRDLSRFHDLGHSLHFPMMGLDCCLTRSLRFMCGYLDRREHKLSGKVLLHPVPFPLRTFCRCRVWSRWWRRARGANWGNRKGGRIRFWVSGASECFDRVSWISHWGANWFGR